MADEIFDLQQPIVRTCRLCRQVFVIDAAEQRELQIIGARAGWPELRWPVTCAPCRFRARAERYGRPVVDDGTDDETRVCVACEQTFTYDRAFFAARGYTAPKRCVDCRRTRRERRA